MLARYFDGESTLAELAEDLAEAAEATEQQARWMTAITTIELHWIGTLLGVRAPDPTSDTIASVPLGPQAGDTDRGAVVTTTRLDPTTGEELQVEQYLNEEGDPVTVVHQPDGTRRVTVEHTYQIGQGDQAAQMPASWPRSSWVDDVRLPSSYPQAPASARSCASTKSPMWSASGAPTARCEAFGATIPR